jgi:hypothetical protein
MSVMIPAVLTEGFRRFSQSPEFNVWILACLKFGHDRFGSYNFKIYNSLILPSV